MHIIAGSRSPARSPLRQIKYVYHFTDTRNVKWIQQLRGLYSIEILQHVGRKAGIELPPAPGGNKQSHWLDRKRDLTKYVHLCLTPSHPMECQARKNGWIRDSVFLQILPDVLHKPDVLFAPDIANKARVQLLPIDQAVNQGWLDCLVDADLSNTRSKQQLRRLEKYELLVPVSIPLDLIVNLPDN